MGLLQARSAISLSIACLVSGCLPSCAAPGSTRPGPCDQQIFVYGQISANELREIALLVDTSGDQTITLVSGEKLPAGELQVITEGSISDAKAYQLKLKNGKWTIMSVSPVITDKFPTSQEAK